MSLQSLASRYIESAEDVIHKIEVSGNSTGFEPGSIVKVIDFARDYLEDAKYYMEKQKFEVSLASVAYCEGLLDALRLLGAVRFEWPLKMRKVRSGK